MKPLQIVFMRYGLALCDVDENLQFDLLQGNLHINHGSILENVFAQELASKNIDLTYYDQKKLGELDFVVQDQNRIHIFEIKSGNDFQKHPALSKAIENKEWHLDDNYVFSKSNLFCAEKITYLPFYMIMFFKIREQETLVGLNDLSMLFPPQS